MISFNFSTSNLKDWIFFSLFAWVVSNLASSSLFLGVVLIVLLFPNRRWEWPLAAKKYYYHEYQTWIKLWNVENYCDFGLNKSLFYSSELYIALFPLMLKNNYVEILLIKFISYIQWNKASYKKFKSNCLLKYLLPHRLGGILSHFHTYSE